MVLPDVRSPVAVVIYTNTHTYKQKVLLYSTFMLNSKATSNGNRHVREYLKCIQVLRASFTRHLATPAQYSYFC